VSVADASLASMEQPVDLAQRWQEILEFERRWWSLRRPKEAAVRGRFGVSAARYYQQLNRLIDRPEALRYDPMLVRRLRRLRDSRRSTRFGRGAAKDEGEGVTGTWARPR
jgi:Protein of unknown function (DUF3263)